MYSFVAILLQMLLGMKEHELEHENHLLPSVSVTEESIGERQGETHLWRNSWSKQSSQQLFQLFYPPVTHVLAKGLCKKNVSF
jgi:hypothetical protein